uniref:Uncharacterized protein n=1 Tax=Picea sitchensis TaxID=3332 RepID=A9NSV0_PICSI|nr:unknown [Picea sitchensis]
MAKFLPANKLSFLRSLLSDLGRTHTRKQRSYATSAGEAASSLAVGSSDGVIPEVASHQQSKAAGGKEHAEEKKKVFWMRDPATGDWIPEDHFGEIDIAELRAKLLSSGK